MSPEAQLLDLFTTDITALARTDKLDPIIGRDTEVERLIAVLCGPPPNSSILIGNRGVGKDAIVEKLAHRIANDNVPDHLKGKRILHFDYSAFMDPTTHEWEAQLRNFIHELKNSEAIFAIDETERFGIKIEPLVTQWLNIVYSPLKRGEITCIVMVRPSELVKLQDIDSGLTLNIKQLEIAEPSSEETRSILHGIKPNYEAFHKTVITDEAIDAAIHLSVRFMPARYLPDKAIDLIDEACAHLRWTKRPHESIMFRRLEAELADIMEDLDELSGTMSNTELLALEKRKRELTSTLTDLQEVSKHEPENLILTAENISSVVEFHTKRG